MDTRQGNILGTEKISTLLFKFTIPTIVSMLVSSIYNIVDQIFIGQGVGMLGNGATNIAYPLSCVCAAMCLMLGVGGAANFSLRSGEGKTDEAKLYAGTAISSSVFFGIGIMTAVLIFLRPLVVALGATDDIFPYALDYVGITAVGIPFLIFGTAGSHIIRADGSPSYSMACLISGTAVNVVLDPIFIFVFHWGIKGAAWATVFGQIVSALMVLIYFMKLSNMRLQRSQFHPSLRRLGRMFALGAAPSINQISICIVQITMNNIFKHYGALSVYGPDIPIAVGGIIAKVNFIYTSICLGVNQGCQPIVGFNFGAKKYARVRESYFQTVRICLIIGVCAFVLFQVFPSQIISIFGGGSELYYQFAVRYFRIFLLLTPVNCLEPLTAGFMTGIGKARRGVCISLSKQLLTLLPLLLIFSRLMGIDGVLYAGPTADTICLIVTLFFSIKTQRELTRLMRETQDLTSPGREPPR